jgi:hypothetical protein
MSRLRSASRIMRLRTRRSWLTVAGSTPSANRASLYSSIYSAETSDNRIPLNAAFNFPMEDPYRLRVLGCAGSYRGGSSKSSHERFSPAGVQRLSRRTVTTSIRSKG